MSEDQKSANVAFWNFNKEQVISTLETGTKVGLSSDVVSQRQKIFGLNQLPDEEKESIFAKIKEQFEDILVRILLAAGVISFIISYFEEDNDEHAIAAWVEPSVIATILIINAFVGIYQDLDAENALEMLKKFQEGAAFVLRDGKWNYSDASKLVPGDIMEIKQGDKILADARILNLSTVTLKIDQSCLTGESEPVTKDEQKISIENAAIQDKSNMVFSGTLVANGQAICAVTSTGIKTEFGQISDQVKQAAEDEEETPLKKKLNEFGDQLAKYITVICFICWLMNIPKFSDPVFGAWWRGAMSYFKVAVALAVAAIPEGLPAVITTCLALGSRRMAQHKAIIRKLTSVETLGCTQIICSDKTGTLTTNEMTVEHFTLLKSNNASELLQFDVEGQSYQTDGDIKVAESSQSLHDYYKGTFAPNLKHFCLSSILCNESKVMWENGRVVRSGLPTEVCLKVLVEKIGKQDPQFNYNNEKDYEVYCSALAENFQKITTLEFTRDRKSMSVLVKDSSNKNPNIMYIKGAPEYIIESSNHIMGADGKIVEFTQQDKQKFNEYTLKYAKKGLRTLAVAMKLDTGVLATYNKTHNHEAHQLLTDTENYAKLEENKIFIGVVAVRDPPRPGVAESIAQCKIAGISVIMITGDIKETAQSIAMDIGILKKGQEDRIFTGKEFENMSKEKRIEVVQQCIGTSSGLVFARTDPKHKRDLVQVLHKDLGQIVAMTGDGVNDAPALRQADIGIAMGIAGTEVAKEASSMVLSDDNFSTIVAAVQEGRAIYNNMKAFISYMISSNIGEVISIFVQSIIGFPDGFNSIQLLWVNLATDGLPATALSFNPPETDVMLKPPRSHSEPLINGFTFFKYMVIGCYVGFATVGIFTYWYLFYDWAEDNHPLITFDQLRTWGQCPSWTDFSVESFGKYDFSQDPCLYFTWGKQKPATLSLTVLVMLEMLNAFNALSDEGSLFKVGFFCNKFLCCAVAGSVVLHSTICYVSFFEGVFGTVPLSLNDWILVIAFSLPIIFVGELLKIESRRRTALALKERLDVDENKKDQ